MMKKTLVMGASHKPQRYSNMAVRMLREYGHDVVAQGRKARPVDDWEIVEGKPQLQDVDTVTLYLNAQNQKDYYDYLLSLRPRRVIFNPGAENFELERKLEENGTEVVNACTLVMLRSRTY